MGIGLAVGNIHRLCVPGSIVARLVQSRIESRPAMMLLALQCSFAGGHVRQQPPVVVCS